MYKRRSKTFPFSLAVMAVLSAFLLTGCEEEKKPQVVKVKRTYKGDVEVLNSCGMQGAAAKMRSYLRENGFDIVSSRNDRLQN